MFAHQTFFAAGAAAGVDWSNWDGTADGAAQLLFNYSNSYIKHYTINDTTVLVVYNDSNDNNKIKVCTLTIDGTSITVNTSYTIYSSASYSWGACVLTDTLSVVMYTDTGSNSHAVPININSSGVITGLGTDKTLQKFCTYPGICKLTATTALVAFGVASGSNYFEIITVSDTTITEGSAYDLWTGTLQKLVLKTASSNYSILIANDTTNAIGKILLIYNYNNIISLINSDTITSALMYEFDICVLDTFSYLIVCRSTATSDYTSVIATTYASNFSFGVSTPVYSGVSSSNTIDTINGTSAFVSYRPGTSGYITGRVVDVDGTSVALHDAVAYDTTATGGLPKSVTKLSDTALLTVYYRSSRPYAMILKP